MVIRKYNKCFLSIFICRFSFFLNFLFIYIASNKTLHTANTKTQKTTPVSTKCFLARQPIIKLFTEKALVGVINRCDPYQSHWDPLSESEYYFLWCKQTCRGLHGLWSLIGEQYTSERCLCQLVCSYKTPCSANYFLSGLEKSDQPIYQTALLIWLSILLVLFFVFTCRVKQTKRSTSGGYRTGIQKMLTAKQHIFILTNVKNPRTFLTSCSAQLIIFNAIVV